MGLGRTGHLLVPIPCLDSLVAAELVVDLGRSPVPSPLALELELARDELGRGMCDGFIFISFESEFDEMETDGWGRRTTYGCCCTSYH